MLKSEMHLVGRVGLPQFTGLRIMMMPFRLEKGLPRMCEQYQPIVDRALADVHCPTREGVAYLTVDEAAVVRGETHRRPGLHVDGVPAGGWGGPPGWGAGGMYVAASHHGCDAWLGELEAVPGLEGLVGEEGSLEHVRAEVLKLPRFPLRAGHLYAVSPGCIHEAQPAQENQLRQFFRLSMPSTADWFENYSWNPDGTQPAGRIMPARAWQMAYRA